jgi:trk system potassium uptake protein TrkH
VGALGLAFCYRAAGFDWGDSAWRGAFHAVSAFCNAGFALQSDSLEMFQGSPVALLLVAALITFGGLGFAVLAAVWWRLRRPDPAPVSVQVKTVLAVSAVLVAAGAALYAAAEWQRTLAGLPVGDRLVNALFQSVTLRTAGFNSVSFAALAPATALAMIGFMFIGASPGSTGGGIKTTTAAVLLAAIRSTVRRAESVRLFDREVPGEIVYRSLAITVISATVVAGGLFLLLVFEPQPFAELLFEVVSAFGTVGLSLGVTPKLGPAGKLIIIAVMFVGRTGPLTLALLLGTGAARAPAVRRPETRVMVG